MNYYNTDSKQGIRVISETGEFDTFLNYNEQLAEIYRLISQDIIDS